MFAGSEFNALPVLRQEGLQPIAVDDEVCQGAPGVIFTMGQYHARTVGGQGVEPVEQFRLPSMSAEAAEFVSRFLPLIIMVSNGVKP